MGFKTKHGKMIGCIEKMKSKYNRYHIGIVYGNNKYLCEYIHAQEYN